MVIFGSVFIFNRVPLAKSMSKFLKLLSWDVLNIQTWIVFRIRQLEKFKRTDDVCHPFLNDSTSWGFLAWAISQTRHMFGLNVLVLWIGNERSAVIVKCYGDWILTERKHWWMQEWHLIIVWGFEPVDAYNFWQQVDQDRTYLSFLFLSIGPKRSAVDWLDIIERRYSIGFWTIWHIYFLVGVGSSKCLSRYDLKQCTLSNFKFSSLLQQINIFRENAQVNKL